jgi:hypothetical protein
VANFQPQQVAGFIRNGWQLSPQRVAGLRQNLQFGTDIEEYIESDMYLNVIEGCDACYEISDEIPYEAKDVG